jgi:CheY-like chemotaxis protein
MGGLIAVESTPEQGSRFWFEIELPVFASAPDANMAQSRQIVGLVGPSQKILVVDDYPDNYHVIHDMLTPLGFTLMEAESGAEALEHLAIFQPDLILLDVRMPGMDGFELARTVRDIAPGPSNPALSEVKIIALSASVFDDTRQQSLSAGCNDFLTKPIRERDLLDMLATHLPIQWRYSEEEEDGTADTQSPHSYAALPSLNDLRQLYEASTIGDIHHLSRQLEQLIAQDAELLPFVEDMQTLLNTFQIDQIHQQLKQLLEHAESTSDAQDDNEATG